MKLICDRAAVLSGLDLVGSLAVQRGPNPVLQCVRLTAVDANRLVLCATDLEVGLHLSVGQVDTKSNGEVLIPAAKLIAILRSCTDATLELSTNGKKDGHALSIIGQKCNFSVFGFKPTEAPTVRHFGELTVDCEIDGKVLETLLSRTTFCMSAENSRYAISGVLFDLINKKLRMVATDGRRLAVATGDCVADAKKRVSCIVPPKAAALLSRLLVDLEAGDMVKIAFETNQILFRIGEGDDVAVLSANLVEGAFPPFEDVIPKDSDIHAEFDNSKLVAAVRQAALLTSQESKGVRLSFADNKLTLTGRAHEIGEAEIELELTKYDGKPLDIGFNPNFIADGLKAAGKSLAVMDLKAPNKPGVIRAGSDFVYVIMPINPA